MTRILFFDLDGCLVDSTLPIRESLNAAFVPLGLPEVTDAELPRYIGPPIRVSFTALAREYGRDQETIEEMIEQYRSFYSVISVEQAISYPGMRETLEALAEVERLVICTSKTQALVPPILEALGYNVFFEAVFGPLQDDEEGKVETLARAVQQVEPFSRHGSAMIGDRYHDMKAAHAHSLTGVGVEWGFGDEAELSGAGAHHIVAKPEELLDIFGVTNPKS